ncbi:MBL fold metallo-hydrolase [Loktanella sp. M215]|uniref:MBL fold metallo-hydrolase n=1 Tax=Loktanella sp. M215 TaxID=2675431 RepID=UPI001F1BD361|nr:MBL fold metallo-hydrolase [Loktanella sp. M215]
MLRIGRFEIERVEEVVLREPKALFAAWDEARVDPIRDWFVGDYYDPEDGSFATSIHTWLVRDGDTTILIDTCGGNHKPRPASPRFDGVDLPFLDRLAEKGVTPESVGYVLLTHLHVDHVGWNTRLEDGTWVPTFPNAKYVMTSIERDWRDPERGAKGKSEAPTYPFLDSVKPVLDNHSNVEIVTGDEEGYLPGIDFMPVPGHAPGMMGIRLRDGGDEALFIADVMHQPIQVSNPGWSSKYCENPDLATETRARVLAHAAHTGCLILPAHFGGTHCGYVRRDGDGYTYEPSKVMP